MHGMPSTLHAWVISRLPSRRPNDEERGQGLVEYGLILSLVALVAVAGVRTFGQTIASWEVWSMAFS